MTVVVAVKWVDLRPDIDALTGEVTGDRRRYGFSAADQAAFEVGLRLADERGTTVTLVSVGPADSEHALLELAACGASAVVRVDDEGRGASSSVGASIAAVAAVAGATLVVCGDYSADRGSGSVPAFAAHGLGWAQALGLIEVGPGAGDQLSVVRRLDGGRREHLTLAGAAVLSVEGSVARLRRASTGALVDARAMPVGSAPLVTGAAGVGAGHAAPVLERTEPVRPRARAFPAPAGERALDRIVDLTGALVERTPPRRLAAEPAEAATAIVEQLRAWGYLS
ncbi:MAG: mycofactocin-associated electron transfer flavoprotein beta subunit [Acidimicrobiales bacterium]